MIYVSNASSLLGWMLGARRRSVRLSDGTLKGDLEVIRAKHDLPALAVAVVKEGKIVAQEAVGVRKHGSDVPVTADDQFHIGSCTKAMTATLIGMLVEQGKLSWATTLAEAFPDRKGDDMHPGLRLVTVDMLLAHRSGLSGESAPKGKTLLDMHRLPGSPREQREAYARMFLRQPPEGKAGKKYLYSNTGYALLGIIAERITDMPWETLMARRLFEALGMKSAGFGAMGTPGKIDQPYQHEVKWGKPQPVEPGPLSDNPAVLGPGGTVHCSVGDWARFVTVHLREGKGPSGDALLKPEMVRRLQAPQFGGEYAGGWLVTERGWGGGRVLTHAGSNTMNFAVVWAAPLKDFAVVIATNTGGNAAPGACDEAAAGMIGRFLA